MRRSTFRVGLASVVARNAQAMLGIGGGIPVDATLPTPTADYVSRTSYPPTLQNLAYVGEDRGIIRFRIEVYSLPNLTTPTITGTIGIGATGLTTLTGTPIVSPTVSVARIRIETAVSYGPWSAFMMHGDISAPNFITTSPVTGNEFVLNETFDISVSAYTDIVLQGGADIGSYSIGPTVAGVATITRIGRAITGTENIILRGKKLNGTYADLALAINYTDVNSTGLAASLTSATGQAQGATVTRTHTVNLPVGVTAPSSIAGFGSYTINGGSAKTSASPVQYVQNGDVLAYSIIAASAWSTNRTQDVSLAGQTITWGNATMANPAGVQITQVSNLPTSNPAMDPSGTTTYTGLNFLAGMQVVAVENVGFRAFAASNPVTIGGVPATRITGISATDPSGGGASTWSLWYVIGTAGAKTVVITLNTGYQECTIQACTIQNYGSTTPSSVAVKAPNYNGGTVDATSSITVPTDGQVVVFMVSYKDNPPSGASAGLAQQSIVCRNSNYDHYMFTGAASGVPGFTGLGGISNIAAIAFGP